MVLTFLGRVVAQLETVEQLKVKLTPWFVENITGNFTGQMETILKITSSEVSLLGKHYYMTWAYALIQLKFLFSYLVVVLTFVISYTLHIRTISWDVHVV